MSSTVRSATVRLEAEVAKYIADMKAAGKATDDAFSKSSVSIARANKNLENHERLTGEVRQESDRTATSLQRLSRETTAYTGELGNLTSQTKQYAKATKNISTESRVASVAQTKLQQDVEQTERSMRRGERGLDSYTGRLGLLAASIGALSPALGPVGGVAIGGLAGLASDAGLAAVAAGSLIVAFHGVGKTIQAVNKAAIDPTDANLKAARLAMEQLSPAARTFVRDFQKIRPVLQQIQGSAASGWFPGLDKAMKELVPLAPVVERIFHDVGQAGGDLLAEGAKSLSSDRWRPFFEFIDREAPAAVTALGHVVGSLTHGLASLWMAFEPTNTGFNKFLTDAAASFDRWATGLSQTQGFHEFIDYLDTNGPRVAATLGAIANAVLQIIEAAAPLAGPTLKGIEAVANALAAIADSPLGTPILSIIQLATAMKLLNSAMGGLGKGRNSIGELALIGPTLDRILPSMARFKAGAVDMRAGFREINSLGGGPLNLFNGAARSSSAEAARFGKGLRSMAAESAKAAAPIAAIAVAQSGVADKIGLSNTVTLALAGSMAGPLGTALGAGAGLVMDFASASSHAADSLQAMNDAASSNDLSVVTTQLAAAKKAQDDFARHNDAKGSIWDKTFGDAIYTGTHALYGYQEQVDRLTARSEYLTQAQLGVSDSFIATAHAAGLTAGQLEALTEKMNAQKDAALAAFDANIGYADALAAARKQAAANNAGINLNTEAGRKNAHALDDLAGSWNKNLDAMKANGASMGEMRHRTAQAKADFIDLATGMGVPIKTAQTLANTLLHIPPKVKPKVELTGAQEAIASIDRLRALITGHPITQTIRVQRVGQSTPNLHGPGSVIADTLTAGVGGKNPGADGYHVPRDGMPYADRYATLVAPGEFIVSNRHGQVDRNIDTLRSINRGYADGGRVPDQQWVATHAKGNQGPGWITGGPWVSQHQLAVWGDLNVKVATLRTHLQDATQALDKEQQVRKALVDKMHQLGDEVQTGLRSDLFGQNDPWSSQYASTSPYGVMATLRGDIGHGNDEIKAIKALRDKGVTGGALAAILSQGGLAGAQAFAKLSKAELAQYTSLYNRREKVLHSAGELAGNAAYGPRVEQMTHQLRELHGDLQQIKQAIAQADHHNREGHKGTKDGIKGAASSAGRHNERKPKR